MTKTRFLSGTALVTVLLFAQVDAPSAQVFIGSSQPDVEVNLDALDSLPQSGGSSARSAVHIHAPAHARHHEQVAPSNSEYSDTTVVGSNGPTSMGLETPTLPPNATTHHRRHVRYRHHRGHGHESRVSTTDLNRRSLTEPEAEGLNPELARLDPAIMTSADLNRLQILCAAVPTGGPRSPLEPASYSPASALPEAPRASIEAIPSDPSQSSDNAVAALSQDKAGSPQDNTRNLNRSELVAENTPPESMGHANIPAPANIRSGASPAAGEARESGRPNSPMPVPTPGSANEPAPPPPPPSDTTMAALPQAPDEAPPAPPRDVQAAAIQAPPRPAPGSSPLSNDDLRVDFQPGGAVVPANEIAKLDKVVARLNGNPDLRIELRSFASSQADSASKARRMSLARALAVKSYLTGQGVGDDRIDVRALGAPDQTATDRVDLFLMR